MATCSITELGFVRILSQVPAYGFTIVQARTQLLRIKKEIPLALLADSHDISRLPAWVKFPKQITDGHLLELARANGALLATLDEILPADAYLIP